MRTLLNIVWVVFAGFWLALGYLLAGLICCVLIVTIPWGVACFRIAGYVFWPFGRAIVARPGAGTFSAIGNIIWFVAAGVWLAIGHVTTAAALAVTIIGLPMAWANLKLIPVTLFPLGKQVVPSSTYFGTVAP